jgi:integrase
VVGIYTGMRRDEIRRMKWSEVDFERTRVVVYKTKNTEPRQVPLPRPALGVLQEWKKARSGDSPLVFPSKKNPKKLLSFRKAWANVVERAGLEDFHFHDLRHTTASYLAMSGASLAEIAEILGHRTLSMVKRYAHLTISHTSTVAERMAAKFSDKPVEAESSSRSHSA